MFQTTNQSKSLSFTVKTLQPVAAASCCTCWDWSHRPALSAWVDAVYVRSNEMNVFLRWPRRFQSEKQMESYVFLDTFPRKHIFGENNSINVNKNHKKTVAALLVSSSFSTYESQLVQTWIMIHKMGETTSKTRVQIWGVHKWGYPQSSSISRWDFPL